MSDVVLIAVISAITTIANALITRRDGNKTRTTVNENHEELKGMTPTGGHPVSYEFLAIQKEPEIEKR